MRCRLCAKMASHHSIVACYIVVSSHTRFTTNSPRHPTRPPKYFYGSRPKTRRAATRGRTRGRAPRRKNPSHRRAARGRAQGLSTPRRLTCRSTRKQKGTANPRKTKQDQPQADRAASTIFGSTTGETGARRSPRSKARREQQAHGHRTPPAWSRPEANVNQSQVLAQRVQNKLTDRRDPKKLCRDGLVRGEAQTAPRVICA